MSSTRSAIPAVAALCLAAAFLATMNAAPRKPVVHPREKSAATPSDVARAVPDVLRPALRQPWATSRVVGTPEPPPPLRVENAYPGIHFNNPVVIIGAPGSDRWFVGEHRGKIFSFPKTHDVQQADLFLDVTKIVPPSESANRSETINNKPVKGMESLYGLTFHPDFATNRYCYVAYVVRGESGVQLPDGTRVSRFKVTETDPPRAIPESEEIIITWLQGGHNGACLAFGPDGCLYISTGDGSFANPPDGLNSGQDVTNLLSAILRIDVDHPDEGKLYSIPADNPFVSLPGARGEIWCYGLRNPWKMKFDRNTGDLWVGDVGWELWELVYKVQRAGNYGWSVVEGRQAVHPERKVGPTPILPPTIEIPHTDGVSVTGGYVYRGKKFPELVGAYVFGDWETRRVWASRWDDLAKSMTPMKDLVDPTVRLVDFAEDEDGELYLLDYDAGTVHELFPNDSATANQAFPTKLSETGLLESVANHVLAQNIHSFEINAAQWADHAIGERFIGVPTTDRIRLSSSKQRIEGSMFQSSMTFPKDTVLAKTLSLEEVQGDPATRRRIETQILHYDGRFWRGYSYAWNEQQTDAELIEPNGRDTTLIVADASAPGGKREQTWHFPSRVECARCHNQWAEYALAFNIRQLNREMTVNSERQNQLEYFESIGLVELSNSAGSKIASTEDAPADDVSSVAALGRFTAPYDESTDISHRARTWLHVNCAHCHRTGGGGSAYIELREELPIDGLKAVDVRPTQSTFEIPDVRIIAAGDPFRSTLFYRISKTGSGRMPHIGSEIVDERGVQLIQQWIRQLPIRTDVRTLIAKLNELDEDRAVEREADEAKKRRARLAQQIANERREAALAASSRDSSAAEKPARVTDEDRAQAAQLDEQQSAERRTKRSQDRESIITTLLSSTPNALVLSRALSDGELTDQVRAQVVDLAVARPEPHLRDLFEQFVPTERRVKRLGAVIKPDQLLTIVGDSDRGRELFFQTQSVQCKNCHRIGEIGGRLGPELSLIGKKYNRAQLLDTILEPSKVIDPKYVSYVVITSGGQAYTGLLADRNEQEIVLRNAKDEVVRIAASDVDEIAPQRQSIMPELLLKDMTAEQVADLLAFLIEQK